MTEEEFRKLETRVYAFSVDVFSFVKTLIDKKLSNEESRLLLNTSNQLYSTFLDVYDHKEGVNPIVVTRCEQLAGICSNYLSKIEVQKQLLNEKVDLTIESNELNRIFKKIDSTNN